MNEIENPMVTVGAVEWERMNAQVPSDNATAEDFDAFAWETDRVADVMIAAFGLCEGDLTEEVAKVIYSGLPQEFVRKLLEDWSSDDDVRDKYNKWRKENE